MTSSYFSDLEEEPISTDPPQESGYFSDLPQQHSRSTGEKAARLAAQYGIGVAELTAFPYEMAVAPLASKKAQLGEYRQNLFEDIERLLEKKATGDWDEQDEELLKSSIAQAESPKESEKFVKTLDVGVGSLAENLSKQLGYDISPEDLPEFLTRLGGNVFSPETLAKSPKLIKRLLSKEARTAAKWDKLATVASKDPQKETMLNFAREHNLTPEESALLMHSEGKAEYLSKIGRKTKRFKNVVQGLKDKLGKNYEELKEFGKTGGYLSANEAEALTDDLGKILSEMTATPVIGPDVKPVVTTLEETIQNIYNKPNTIKELINGRQQIAQSINWRAVDQGDMFRQQARQAFLDAITKKNPAIGKRLADTDKAWAKFQKFENVLDKKIPTIRFKGLEVPVPFLEAIAFAGAPFIPFGMPLLKGVIAKNLVQRFTTELAINPSFQAPVKSLQRAMISGNPAKQKQAWILIKKMMNKENPELSDELSDFEVD